MQKATHSPARQLYIEHNRGLWIDGKEVQQLRFLRYRFTEADRDSFHGQTPPKDSFAYDVSFDFLDGAKSEHQHITPAALEAAIGKKNIADIEANKDNTSTLNRFHAYDGVDPNVHRIREHTAWLDKTRELGQNSIERDDGLDLGEVIAETLHDQKGHTVERLGRDAENRGQNIDTLSDLAERQKEAGAKPRDTDQEVGEQANALARVHASFCAVGPDYYHRNSEKLAFSSQRGMLSDRFVTSSNDERVASGMVDLAAARGWKSIKVSGHPEFRRKVWLEAKMKGIEIKGFVPKGQDLADLKARQARKMHNSIMRHQSPREQIASAVAGKLLDGHIANPGILARAMERINIGLRKRAESGHVPGIPMYDKSAQPRDLPKIQKIKHREHAHERSER